MTTPKLIVLLVFIPLTQLCHGQKISNINFDEIQGIIQDTSSTRYYPLLLERFLNGDTSLTQKDYKLIYYGCIYQENYQPYGMPMEMIKFSEFYKDEKFKKAISLGEEMLGKNPINLTLLYNMMACHHQVGDKEAAGIYARMYFPLMDALLASGDGQSMKTAYVVATVADEYQILGQLGLRMTEQALINDTDVLTIQKKGQDPVKGKNKIDKLYFNVSKPMDYLDQQFKKKE